MGPSFAKFRLRIQWICCWHRKQHRQTHCQRHHSRRRPGQVLIEASPDSGCSQHVGSLRGPVATLHDMQWKSSSKRTFSPPKGEISSSIFYRANLCHLTLTPWPSLMLLDPLTCVTVGKGSVKISTSQSRRRPYFATTQTLGKNEGHEVTKLWRNKNSTWERFFRSDLCLLHIASFALVFIKQLYCLDSPG